MLAEQATIININKTNNSSNENVNIHQYISDKLAHSRLINVRLDVSLSSEYSIEWEPSVLPPHYS